MRYLVGFICVLTLGVMLAVGCSESNPAHVDYVSASEREMIAFQVEHELTDEDYAVYVLGSLPELGSDDITRSVKMVSDDRTNWSVAISLPVGQGYSYRFYAREWQLPLSTTNGDPVGDERTVEAVKLPLRPSGKVLYAHSSFDPPVLHWRQADGSYEAVTMEEMGTGRSDAEKRWVAGPFGESQRPVEFYLTNLNESERDPSGDAAYKTPLEVAFLQDNNLFTYVPAASVSAPRRDYELLTDNFSSTLISSEILGEEYEYRVFLPRGYSEHVERRYPVLYMQDGVLVWDAEAAADPDGEMTANMIRRGEVGEMIVVAVTSLERGECAWPERRARDYLPPGSNAQNPGCQAVDGEADKYVAFLTDELKPFIDRTYRTLSDAAHTFDAGFSWGAVVAFYMGWEFDDTFSRIGVQSVGTAGYIPYFDSIVHDLKPSTRFYLDSSHLELGPFNKALSIRDDLLARSEDPFVLEDDLRYLAGESIGHSWPAAGSRWPAMLPFLYPATDETPECYDGIDNDSDGWTDHVPDAPDSDPDCTSALDPSEGDA